MSHIPKHDLYSYHSKRIDCVVEKEANYSYTVVLSVDGIVTERVELSFIEDTRHIVKELVAQAYLDLDAAVPTSEIRS